MAAGGGRAWGCAEVRDALPEHALGVLPEERATAVERHLSWCAGCRKEAAELAAGAASAGFLLEAREPPAGLGERVVLAIAGVAGRRRHRMPAVAAAVAAAVALATSGWAVSMSGRVERLEEVAATAEGRAARFEDVLRGLDRDSPGRVRSAELGTLGRGRGGGRAIAFDGPGAGSDWVLVIAGGLPDGSGPYSAQVGSGGARRVVGSLFPSAAGELATYRFFVGDVSGFETVWVVDGRDRTVLSGTLARYRG